MKNLIKDKFEFIVTSMHFNDFHNGKDGDFTFNVKLDIANYQTFISKKLDKIKFISRVAVISTVEDKSIGFTFDASIQIVVDLKENVTEKEIKEITNNKQDKGFKLIDEAIRPIIASEIGRILDNTTFYTGITLS